MCSLKSIIAEVFENISMRYLVCSLDKIGLVSIIISSNCLFSSLCCGEILSWSSQQVVYRWLCKPAIFQELFQRWLRWPFFNHSFHLRSFKIGFFSSNYWKVLFCCGDWMKLKWFKFVNANHTYSSCGEVISGKMARCSDRHFTLTRSFKLLKPKTLYRYITFLTGWLNGRYWTSSCSLSGPSLLFIGNNLARASDWF